MKRQHQFRSGWAILTLMLIITLCGNFGFAQEPVTKSKVIELTQRFISENQSTMKYLEGSTFEEPQLIRDKESNPIHWRVEVLNNGRRMGYFYAEPNLKDDGGLPVWFAGPGNATKLESKTPQIERAAGKGVQGAGQEALSKKEMVKQRNAQYFEESPVAPEKGQSTPRMGYSELTFDPTSMKRISTEDEGKVPNTESRPNIPTGWNLIKYEDMEGSFPNDWSIYAASGYADAYWDDTSYKAYDGSWGCWCADLGSEHGAYGGDYVNDMYAWMIYGPFDLSSSSDAFVDFWHYTKTEYNYDRFHFVASTNGTNYYGTYSTGDHTGDSGNVNGWIYQYFDLTDVYSIGDLTGESQVWFAFVFTSDGTVVDEGTYTDEVYIYEYSGGGGNPVLSDHFMCRDGDNPHATATTNFSTTDAIAAQYHDWNSSSCASSNDIGSDFYDDTGSYYWGATTSLPAGYSSYTWWAGIYIQGYYPETHPGTYQARVMLNSSEEARDYFTVSSGGGAPTLTEHFTCSDGNDPYNTATTTFATTDYIAAEYTVWNTSGCTRDWTGNKSFYYPDGSYYAGLDFNIDQGYSSWDYWVGIYIQGHDPETNPGEWHVRVSLEGSELARDYFTIGGGGTGGEIRITPTSLDIYQTPLSQQEYTPPENDEPCLIDGRYARGLVIPEDVKAYWETHEPELNYNLNDLKASVDWSGNDSPVKNQGYCGSCWAFAAIALVENLGGYSDLSEQVIVSCAPGDCGGGWYWDAFEYIHNDGVSPENCYPYIAANGNCSNKCTDPDYLVKLTDYDAAWGLWGEPATVAQMKAELANGPYAVALLVPTDGTFDSYSGGVYNYSGGYISWSGNGHAVLLVGYNDSGQYFKFKNSWGTGWGESGYGRIAYDDVTDDMHFGMYASSCSGIYQEGGGGGQTFLIENVHATENLEIYNMYDNQDWLVFSPTFTGIIPPGGGQTISVDVSNWGLVNCPEEEGRIFVESSDLDEPTRQVTVTAHCAGTDPILVVNPNALSFSSSYGSNPPAQTFNISNGGGGSFNWTATESASWLSCAPNSGSVTTETDVVSVSINTAGLAQGNYNTNITVNAPGAIGSPQTVAVSFQYGDAPCTPPYIKAEDFGGSQGSEVWAEVSIAQNPSSIDAFGFRYVYNSSKLTMLEVQKGNLNNHFSFFQASEGPAGTLTIGGFDTTPIPSGSNGTIARIRFRVDVCNEGETFPVTISNLTDDLVGLNICNGTFTCGSDCDRGDVNMDGAISPGDALCAFQIYLNGGTPPPGECNTECAVEAADVNCSPNGVTPGDALYIFQAYLAGETPPLDCDPTTTTAQGFGDVGISLVKLESSAVDEITVAVQVSNPEGLSAFGIDLGFPEDILTLVEVKSTSLTELWQAVDGLENVAGVVSIGGFNPEAISVSSGGYLATATFRVMEGVCGDVEFWMFNNVDDLADAKLTAESYLFPLAPTNVREIDQGSVPETFSLDQNYPNPFNMQTEIVYQLPEAAQLTLAIYNSMGQEIKTLVSQKQDAGRYAAHWDGKDSNGNDLPSGVYIYKLSTSKFVSAKKLILIK